MANTQQVNIGTSPNDGTGDPLRTMGTKYNAHGHPIADIDGLLLAARTVASGNTNMIAGDELGRTVRLSSSGNQDFQIDDDGDSGVTFAVGSKVVVRKSAATGIKRVVADTGVTFNPPGPLTIANQDQVLVLEKVAANEWDVTGA